MKTCPICEKSWPSNHANCPTDGALLIDLRELEPGTVIRGKYRIVRQLGRGGMGTVYLAEHILLNRPRALKFISSELSQDAAFLRRFRREAQAAIELRHPNIVEVVDLDQAEDGSPYIAMEYVEGPDLRHALDTIKSCHPERTLSAAKGESKDLHFGLFPVERALSIARGIALGLGAAHAKGIIHRDVKPENILLAEGEGKPETPKLLDFGIAAMKESATVVSHTHGLLLTPPYAAPEQWKGMAAEDLDGRADLYALGGVFYEMLTGRSPFHAANTEGWMYQHLQEQPQPPSNLRPELANWPGLDALVLRLLAKDRDQRPRDAGELVGLLDAARFVAPSARRETVREDVKPPERQVTIQEERGAASVSDKRPPEREPELPQPVHEPILTPSRSKITIWVMAAALIVLGLGAWAVVRFTQSPASTSSDSAQTTAQPGSISTPMANKPSKPASVVPATASGGVTNPAAQRGTNPIPSSNNATLLVTCDLACNWKLDGRTQGRIAAGDTAKALVEPGAVFQVEATTEDGADKTGWTARVEAARTDVNLQLRPVRDARLKAEQAARASVKIATPKKMFISSGVMAGMIVLKTQPVYPPIAKAARVSGTVVLQATISKTGAIENLHVISGPQMLVQAAQDAVRQWRYKPYLFNGEPVDVETTVNVIFSLGG
ncbi:MAG: TonB family protein [Terracidiphilus sp.]|jgi:serine/threonine-protein kinase